MSECFITSDADRAYIDKVGNDYIIIKDIFTKEEFKINVDKGLATHFKNECANGEVLYVFYDKEKKELKL